MMTPLGIYNRHIAEKARIEALSKSSVKVVGADVMATKKLITAIKMYPLLSISFTVFFYYLLKNYTEVSSGQRMMWTGTFFVMFPLYCWVCILSRDNLIYYYQLLQSRLLCLFYTENMFLLK